MTTNEILDWWRRMDAKVTVPTANSAKIEWENHSEEARGGTFREALTAASLKILMTVFEEMAL